MQFPVWITVVDARLESHATAPCDPLCPSPRFALLASAALAVVASAACTGAQAAEASGAAVFEAVCAECHENGERGAPRIGDRAAWAARSAKGLDRLLAAARNGTCGMPPQEGYAKATALEIERAIVYMVNQSGGRWIEPAARGAAGRLRSGKQVAQAHCALCHAEGISGAPRVGDTAAWQKRLRLGMDRAVQSAIRGNPNMPQRGGGADLTDEEIRGTIAYMAGRTEPSSQMLPANRNSTDSGRTR